MTIVTAHRSESAEQVFSMQWSVAIVKATVRKDTVAQKNKTSLGSIV